jgi:nitrogen fixation-related uncharacterized protein
MEESNFIFLLVIIGVVAIAVAIYALIIAIYTYQTGKAQKQAEEIFAKTAHLNLRVEPNKELFKREEEKKKSPS